MSGITKGYRDDRRQNRMPIYSDTDRKRRRLVIDVPPNGTTLQFGFFLKGSGAVWSADFAVAAVDAGAALTGRPYESLPRDPSWLQPANLDFSRTVKRKLDPGGSFGLLKANGPRAPQTMAQLRSLLLKAWADVQVDIYSSIRFDVCAKRWYLARIY